MNLSQPDLRRPAHRRPVFHRLRVVDVGRLTDEAVVVSFAVPEELRDTYAFRAGQHLTVRHTGAAGVEIRRSYSICSTPMELAGSGTVRIGVRRIAGGAFSTYATEGLRAGAEVDVLPPLGGFTTGFDPERTRRYAAIVAGSGITPVLSLAATGLATEPHSTMTILYANRGTASVMFLDELADLKDRHPTRLQVVHVLTQEPGPAPLLHGRLDVERLPVVLDALVPSDMDEWFLCGPFGMVVDARAVLAARGVPAAGVHVELFHVPGEGEPPVAPPEPPAEAPVELMVRLDGRESALRMGRDERVLDAALRARGELPFACRGGVCATCRARLVEGRVELVHNWALDEGELAAGYVLTCQAHPLTDRLVVDYDG